MAMEGVRSSLLAALLFLTLVVLTASATASGADDAAAAAMEEHNPLPDEEPYMLVTTILNKDGEEIRLLADNKGTKTLSASGFANRFGHWFYTIREGKRGNTTNHPQPSNTPASSRGSRNTEAAEGFWTTLGAVGNATAASDDDDDDDEQGYMLLGMETSGGDKIRLVVVVDQRYFSLAGNANGFGSCPRWSFFRNSGRHRLVIPPLGSNDDASSHGGDGGSHAEAVASIVLAALIKGGCSIMSCGSLAG